MSHLLAELRDELLRQLSARECVELSVTLFVAGISYVQRRTIRWLRELSEREQLRTEKLRLDDRQREFFRHKETVRTMFEASWTGSRLSLNELLENSELDWSTRSSTAPSAPSDSPSTPPPESSARSTGSK